jgi:hypothetical protein
LSGRGFEGGFEKFGGERLIARRGFRGEGGSAGGCGLDLGNERVDCGVGSAAEKSGQAQADGEQSDTCFHERKVFSPADPGGLKKGSRRKCQQGLFESSPGLYPL